MRRPRKIQIGGVYHVVARANRREFILRSAHVKRMFLQTVQREKTKYSFRIINMCVMDNHFHLMIEPGHEESLSKIMQWILSVFARRFNRAYSLQGHVWYDRFKSKIVSSLRQFTATFAYIDENPVRAELMANSGDYPYGGRAFIRARPGVLVDRPRGWWSLCFRRSSSPAFPARCGDPAARPRRFVATLSRREPPGDLKGLQ